MRASLFLLPLFHRSVQGCSRSCPELPLLTLLEPSPPVLLPQPHGRHRCVSAAAAALPDTAATLSAVYHGGCRTWSPSCSCPQPAGPPGGTRRRTSPLHGSPWYFRLGSSTSAPCCGRLPLMLMRQYSTVTAHRVAESCGCRWMLCTLSSQKTKLAAIAVSQATKLPREAM